MPEIAALALLARNDSKTDCPSLRGHIVPVAISYGLPVIASGKAAWQSLT